MTQDWMLIGNLLLLAAAGFKLKTMLDLRKLRADQAELVQERQRLHDARMQSQTVIDRVEIQERELTNDVRDLVRELSETERKIERLQEDLSKEDD